MTLSFRKMFAPALLAAALVPMAMSAQANPHDGQNREQMRERMQEQRQEVYQRAELDAEKQAALEEANAEFFDAMKALHDEHEARVGEILTEQEQQAVKDAMREMRDERRSEHGGQRDHHRGERGQQSGDQAENDDAVTTQ